MTLLLSAVLSELPIPAEDRLTSTTHNPVGLKCFNMCSVTVEKDVNCDKQEIAPLMRATAGTTVLFPFFSLPPVPSVCLEIGYYTLN